ncbi:MAG: DUF1559 domain-containing protein [Armatimonadota bacterium]|jgi:prepilin-type processing-associated H-X9-DG protein
MECPKCRESVNDAATSCPACDAPLTWQVLMPDGESFGPYSTEALRQYVADGRIPATANLRHEGTGLQMSLSQGGFPPDTPPPSAPPPPAGPPPAVPPSPERRGHLQRNWPAYLIAGVVAVVVVIPIIVLAAILFPVFAKAKEKARQAACMSNIKQLGMACMMYATDNDGQLPTAVDAQGFHDAISPYVQNEGLFTCPSARDEQSYAFNPNLAGVNIEELPDAMNTPMLWEAGAQPGGLPPVPGTTTGRHNGGDNVAFADGHCKWYRSAAMGDLSTEVGSDGGAGG